MTTDRAPHADAMAGAAAEAAAGAAASPPPASPRLPARFVLAGFALAAIALLAIFEWLPIDLQVQRALFDPALGDFRWHRDAQLEYWLHVQARRLLYVVPAAVALAGIVASVRARVGSSRGRGRWCGRERELERAHERERDRARRMRFVFVALLVAPTAVSLAKQLTDRPCPWDLAEFGGGPRVYGLFEPAPAGTRSLACFPAGHASGGFALFAFALAAAADGRRRRVVVVWAALSVGLGALLGAVRVLQGAHFVSHVLWLAWLVALVQWWLARWMLPAPAGTADSARSAEGLAAPTVRDGQAGSAIDAARPSARAPGG